MERSNPRARDQLTEEGPAGIFPRRMERVSKASRWRRPGGVAGCPRCKVLIIDARSPDEARRTGGATSFIRALRPYLPKDWMIATPDPVERATPAAPFDADRSISLGPALDSRRIPERILFPLRVLRLRRRLLALAPELVYCHSNEIAMLHCLLFHGRFFQGAAFALHQHGAENALSRATFRWGRLELIVRGYEALQRSSHRRCDVVVAIDEACRQKNLVWGVEKSLLMLPNAVDTARFFPEEGDIREGRSVWGFGDWDVMFLHAGRIEEVKRQEVIIGAFELAAPRLLPRRAGLAIAGTGTLACALADRVASSPLRGQIRLLGNVSPTDMPKLMRIADGFVLASEFEGVPMVLLEAMASGVPAAAPAIGGIPDMLSPDEGILLPSVPSVEAVAAGMLSIVTVRWDRKSISQSAQRFGAAQAVARLSGRFDAVVKSRVGRMGGLP